jgi:hypothetical protein
MDSPYRILFAALLAISSVGFFSVLWVVPTYYKFFSRRLIFVMRTLYCAIGCGYIVLAYFVLQDFRPVGAFIFVLVFCSTLNLIVLGVERPWSRRGQPSTAPHD